VSTAIAESLAIESLIKAQAFGLGFDLVGITTLGPMETAAHFDEWVERGYAGEMDYLGRGAEKRRDSRLPFHGATHAIVVGLNYGGREPSGPDRGVRRPPAPLRSGGRPRTRQSPLRRSAL